MPLDACRKVDEKLQLAAWLLDTGVPEAELDSLVARLAAEMVASGEPPRARCAAPQAAPPARARAKRGAALRPPARACLTTRRPIPFPRTPPPPPHPTPHLKPRICLPYRFTLILALALVLALALALTLTLTLTCAAGVAHSAAPGRAVSLAALWHLALVVVA